MGSLVTARAIHIITGEYPPTIGGVSDYTGVVSAALADAGEAVHVWCPGFEADPSLERGVFVHRMLGTLGRADLRRAESALDAFPAPRRLLLQWVPHAFGRRSMNVGFCRWIATRAAAGDCVEIMVHEPFLPFRAGPRGVAAAAMHRLMTVILLGAARRVWLATPAWGPMWRPYALGRDVAFTWLPEPASVPPDPGAGVRALRIRERLLPHGGTVIGTFSVDAARVGGMLCDAVVRALGEASPVAVLLIGGGSTRMRDALVARAPALSNQVDATGIIDQEDISTQLTACDVMLQPYADGISTRHSSAMTVLAHGVPMVTTRGRFTESVWPQSGAVTLVEVGDGDAMGHAAARLAADAELRVDLRHRSLALYRERFEVSHTVSAILGVPSCA